MFLRGRTSSGAGIPPAGALADDGQGCAVAGGCEFACAERLECAGSCECCILLIREAQTRQCDIWIHGERIPNALFHPEPRQARRSVVSAAGAHLPTRPLLKRFVKHEEEVDALQPAPLEARPDLGRVIR